MSERVVKLRPPDKFCILVYIIPIQTTNTPKIYIYFLRVHLNIAHAHIRTVVIVSGMHIITTHPSGLTSYKAC